jgi:hypothetical protein
VNTVTDAAINDLTACQRENALLIETLRCAEAWLTQPVQFTKSENVSAILRGDCKAAVTAIRAALAKVAANAGAV